MVEICLGIILVMLKAVKYVSTDKVEIAHLDNVIIEITCMIVVIAILTVVLFGLIKLIYYFISRDNPYGTINNKTARYLAEMISFGITLYIFQEIDINYIKFLSAILT